MKTLFQSCVERTTFGSCFASFNYISFPQHYWSLVKLLTEVYELWFICRHFAKSYFISGTYQRLLASNPLENSPPHHCIPSTFHHESLHSFPSSTKFLTVTYCSFSVICQHVRPSYLNYSFITLVWGYLHLCLSYRTDVLHNLIKSTLISSIPWRFFIIIGYSCAILYRGLFHCHRHCSPSSSSLSWHLFYRPFATAISTQL